MVEKNNKRLILDMDQMLQLRRILYDLIIFRTSESISVGNTCLARIAKDKAKALEVDHAEQDFVFQLGFKGMLGTNMVTPRGLCTKMMFQLVRVCGIVTKVSEVCSRLEQSVHFCEATDKGHV